MPDKLAGCARTVAIFAFAALACFAQTQTARLTGTVHDSSGAVVPNAKVTAVNTATRVETEATTNASGDYVMPALQPGVYSLLVEASGFNKASIQAIQLDAASNVSQSVTLEVGQMSEVVEVAANAVNVQTTDAQVANSVTIKDIETLPQLARTPITLAIFQPGVQINPQANGSSSGADYSYAHVNGLRQGSNNNTLDGIDVNDAVAPRMGLSMTANNTDSVEEARVVTDGGKAEYGRSAGAQIQLVTRSGTNNFHGNAFDYLRNRDLNANDFFNNGAGVPIPVLIQNLFGGSIGGPIRHNKLFFFGNYQGRRTHAQGIQNTIVPTATAQQGIFQWKDSSGAIQQYNIVANDPLHKGIDPFVASMLKLYPAPNSTNCSSADYLNQGCYSFNFPNGSLEDQFTVKVDYNLNDKMHIFERTSWQRNSSIDSLNSAQNIIPGEPAGSQGGKRWGVAGGWDWTISGTLVNEFRYGHQSAGVDFVRPERVAGPMLTFNTWTFANGSPLLTAFPQGRNSPVNEYTDNLTKVHGNHTFKFGGQMRFTKQYGYNDAGIYPNITLSLSNGNVPTITPPAGLTSTQLTAFQGMYNDLLGRMSQVTQTYYSNLTTFQQAGTPRVRNFLFHEYGYFAQDDWKVTPHLTLNLGLRWEFFPVPKEQDGQQGIITPANVLNTAGISSSLTVQPSTKWWNNDYHSFAPRFGFAWDPFGDGKTSIRGGFGIFYDRMIGAAASSVDGATPGFSQVVNLYPNSTAASDARIGTAPPLPTQPSAPALTLPATRGFTTLDVMSPNLTNGYVAQANLSVQREIAKNTIFEAGFVGNRGIKLFYQTNLNQSYIYNNGFLTAFNQIASNLTNLSAVPLTNPIVSIFGTAQAAVTAIGSSTFSTGQVGTAANTIDVNNYSKYAAAGIPNTYLRHFPQVQNLLLGNNDGRSEYNSLQLRLQRQFSTLRVAANYTWSKSIDNVPSGGITGGEGNGFAAPIDSFNEALSRGRSGFDIPHVLSLNSQYTLPVGKGHMFGGNMPHWANTLIGGWEAGGLWIWESGSPFTVSSGRNTGPSTNNTWADYTGSRNVGGVMTSNNGVGPGVYYFTPAEIAAFSEPAAGTIGTSGRNTFRGPGFFNIDFSMVKRFELWERKYLTFRAEAYNLINHPDFQNPGVNLGGTATIGKITAVVNNPRIVQLALRLDF